MAQKNKRICKECGSSFNASPKWDYELCKDCSIALYERVEKFWFTEILGYSEMLDKFLPPLPRPLFNVSLKEYAANLRGQFDIGDGRTGREAANELKASGAAEKERLLKKLPPKTVKCKKCGEPYTVDGIWQYNICKKCAVQEVLDWRAYWVKQVPGIGTLRAGFDIPPIEVSKYYIEPQ